MPLKKHLLTLFDLNKFKPYLILLLFLICFGIKGVNAQKTDTIIHINGNVMTGDFKKLSYGVVTWKMDGMGTINYEQLKIKKIKSKKQFEIKTRDGVLYFGSMDTTQHDREVNIITGSDTILMDFSNIVEIYRIKNSFWARASGSASLGGNYSKGSEVGSLALSGNMDYRKRRTYFMLSFDDNNTYQGDSLSSSNSNITLAWQRLLKKRWSTELSVAASQNTSLGSKLKYDVNVMGVYDISYNSWNRLTLGSGLNATRETSYEDSEQTYDLAGMAAVVWKVYRYRQPKVWVDASFKIQPYITNAGRVITSFNINPQVNLISDDFKVGLSFYHNYDNRPPAGATSKSDYTATIQFSYTFH